MMHELDPILMPTGGFAAALVCGSATSRLGLAPIVGYLIAGVAAGPDTPGFAADTGLAAQFAEVGVFPLMSGVGLHSHLDERLGGGG